MAGRRVVKLDTMRPYHPYMKPDGEKGLASPTVDSLLKRRRVKKAQKGRVVIRHKREY